LKFERKIPINNDWIEAKETVEGTYEGKYVFPEPGTYYVQIHVEKEEGLHEHSKKTIEVQ
jgi:hypothetical protein